MADDLLYPSRIGAPGTLNFDTRREGRAVPAFIQRVIRDSDRTHYFVSAMELKAPDGTSTGGQPRIYAPVAQEMRMVNNGAETQDTTFGDTVQGMTVFNPGGFLGEATAVSSTTLTDTRQNWPVNYFASRTVTMGGQSTTVSSNTATVLTVSAWSTTPTLGPYVLDGSGTPSLLVTFGTSGTLRSARRSLVTDTTPWTTNTASSYAQLWLITRVGGAGYAAMTDAGVAAIGEWRVSICPLGNDPQLASSWGNGFEIGGPEWGITGLTAIGNAPVVGKPDGLWFYDTQTRRYENVLRHLELVPHALNGKVTEAVTGGVVYTTHDGHAYFFDGVSVSEVSPHKFWPILSRDIGNSRITAIADSGDVIAMATETAYQTTQNAGLDIRTVTSALAATSITANTVDGSLATGGDVSSLAATSFIDVWADIPFEGVVFHVTRLSNSTTAAVFATVSYSSAPDTFVAGTGIVDGTRLSTGGSLSYVAFPPSASAGVVMAKDLNFGALMQKIDFNYSTGTDISQKYGMRIAMSGAAFDATTNIDEIEIIPYRAGMPNGGIYTTANNFTNRDRAGLVTHVYLIKREKTTGFVPHDSYAAYTYPGVWKMVWHTGRLGQASGQQNVGQSLFLFGRYRTIAINESITRDPVRTRYPILQGVGTVAPGPLIQIAHDWRGKPNEWHLYKTLDRLLLDTRFVQPTDEIEVFAQFDERDIISLGKAEGGPLFYTPGNGAPFRYLNLWLGFKQAATTLESAPYFVEPYVIEYTTHGDAEAKDAASPVVPLT